MEAFPSRFALTSLRPSGWPVPSSSRPRTEQIYGQVAPAPRAMATTYLLDVTGARGTIDPRNRPWSCDLAQCLQASLVKQILVVEPFDSHLPQQGMWPISPPRCPPPKTSPCTIADLLTAPIAARGASLHKVCACRRARTMPPEGPFAEVPLLDRCGRQSLEAPRRRLSPRPGCALVFGGHLDGRLLPPSGGAAQLGGRGGSPGCWQEALALGPIGS